jgi:ribonuclease R
VPASRQRGGARSVFPRRNARVEHARSPDTAIVIVTGTDADGDAVARPADWNPADGPAPVVFMAAEPRGHPALAPGERVLVRLRPAGRDRYEGRTVRRLAEAPGRILGVFRHGRIVPTDRRGKAEWVVPPGQDGGAQPGEIVLGEALPHHPIGPRPARIVERLGAMGDARAVSLIAIHTHDIPQEFPRAALDEALRARATPLGHRTDLRDIPLVTIDGEDARDFDDAVYAEPDGAGFRLLVAIADVAHYVRPGSALDQAAGRRGNSVYFPDRVVPMLPERLSNGWCSLRPGEDRGCLFVELRIDAEGHKLGHRFGRGLMRSAARLTYAEVQRTHDGGAREYGHLYAAFRALLAARQARGALDLDLPERGVTLDRNGIVRSVAPRPRLDSHRLIEEFMVLANVAAAEELERLRQPAMYRVHTPPSEEKLASLRGFLHGLGLSLPEADQVRPRDLERVLRRAAGTPDAPLVNEVMLRSQSQAAYSPDNIGHFGLALPRYAHFTSPIRRYADLLVHRALIRALRLGTGALTTADAERFAGTARHISATERRAQLAERDAIDRYLAAYMADKVGGNFAARISGVTRFGLFVTVTESGASGLVPVRSLPGDFWQYDAREQVLRGRRTHLAFRLAQEVEVRLAEASPVTGGLVFHILQGAPDRRGGKQRKGAQRRSR